MKTLKQIAYCISVLLLGFPTLKAQEAIPVAGGELSGSGGTASYSVGQLFYTSIQDDNYSVSQGIQQPYEILIIASYEYPETINLDCKVYPNPVSNFLVLNIETINTDRFSSLSYKLYDTGGNLLASNNGLEAINTIDMTKYSQGSYFLTVLYDKQKLKLFKIIKN